MSKIKNFLTSLIGYTHCSTHHEELRTKKGMIDVAIWAMRQVKCHFVNDKVTANMKSNFARMLCETQKCTVTMPIFHCYKYTSAISNKLVKLQDDPGFTEKELYSRHAFAERTLHGGGNRNRSKKKMVIPNATTVQTSVSYPPTASANNVDTVSTYAPSPTNKSSSTFNVLEFTTAASPSNQTVSTQVTTPPVRNITKHVDNQAPSVYMGDKLTKNYETPNRQPSSSASSSISSTSTEHDSLKSKNQNGLFFRPDCSSYCMTQIQKADNPCHQQHPNVIHVPLNDPGEYVIFPATTYHRGYYNGEIQQTFFTAQLFAEYKSSDDIPTSRIDHSQYYQLKRVLPCKVTALFNDLRCYWDIHYPASEYPPPNQYKLMDVDVSSNRVIDKACFCNTRPFLNNLISMFEHLYPSLDFQSVWFIRKRDVGDGFQSWHKDLINNAKTAITIVVNVGSYIDPTDTDESDITGSYLYDNNKDFDKRNELYFHSLDNDKNLDCA